MNRIALPALVAFINGCQPAAPVPSLPDLLQAAGDLATVPDLATAPDLAPAPGDMALTASYPPHTSLYWQLTGKVDLARPEQVYDIDLFGAAPDGSFLLEPDGKKIVLTAGTNAGAVAQLHAAGKKVICYVDTGAWENYRPDAAVFPAPILGAVDPNWPNERWLDIRAASWPVFEGIILARFDLAARLGCDGVEGDQNNSAGNNPGFPITIADEVAWYKELARQLHARGLAAIMKNGVEILADPSAATVIALHDGALNEQCNEFSECAGYAAFIAANKVVWDVEYKVMPPAFCPMDNASNLDGYYAALALDGTTWKNCR